MKNYILGSGLVGLMAKNILSNEWDIIPHGTSRYYSWPVALADDFIPVSIKNDYTSILTPDTRVIRRAFSMAGELIFAPLPWISSIYTNKVYDEPIAAFNRIVNMEQMVSRIPCHTMYKNLLGSNIEMLTANSQKYGKIKHIVNNKIITDKTTLPYDNIISTIPLDALMQYIKVDNTLRSKDVWVYHIKTNKLNFEGADQVFIADPEIDFFKVNKLDETNYIFFCLKPIITPMEYFGAFMENDLIVINPKGTLCKSFIPIGGPLNLSWLKKDFNIQCIGSNAQWDAFADIGTCMVRLLNISI